jgi:hypothetical protein
MFAMALEALVDGAALRSGAPALLVPSAKRC